LYGENIIGFYHKNIETVLETSKEIGLEINAGWATVRSHVT
jgi:hypothetical protein